MISTSLFKTISPKIKPDILAGLVAYLEDAMIQADITSPLRQSHFLAQIAMESDGFSTLTEYASGREYEGRRDLGNTVAGDGPRFRGRGLIMLTGRSNYKEAGELLDVDLIGHPELAATPQVAVYTAALYWRDHGCNALADKDDLVGVTRKVNGGTNGLEIRRTYLVRAKRALMASPITLAPIVADVPTTAPVVAAVPAAAPAPVKLGFWQRLHAMLSRKA